MATTSLWHIEGRLKDLIAYVENPEKTRADNPNLQPLWDIFSYVSRPEVIEQGEYVSAINCLIYRLARLLEFQARRGYARTGAPNRVADRKRNVGQ